MFSTRAKVLSARHEQDDANVDMLVGRLHCLRGKTPYDVGRLLRVSARRLPLSKVRVVGFPEARKWKRNYSTRKKTTNVAWL